MRLVPDVFINMQIVNVVGLKLLGNTNYNTVYILFLFPSVVVESVRVVPVKCMKAFSQHLLGPGQHSFTKKVHHSLDLLTRVFL